MKTRKWQDKETGADRYSTDIVADQMQMLGAGREGGEEQADESQNSVSRVPASRTTVNPQSSAGGAVVDDIPFRQRGAGRVWACL